MRTRVLPSSAISAFSAMKRAVADELRRYG